MPLTACEVLEPLATLRPYGRCKKNSAQLCLHCVHAGNSEVYILLLSCA